MSEATSKRAAECEDGNHGIKRRRTGGVGIVNEDLRREKVPLLLWHGSRGLARVCEERGKHVNRMGFSRKGVKWLWPEETAFLVSEGEADLAMLVDLKKGPEEPTNSATDSSGTSSEGTPANTDVCKIMDLEEAYGVAYGALDTHNVALVDYYAFVALKKLRFNVFRVGRDTWASPPAELWFERTEVADGAEVEAMMALEDFAGGVELRYDVYSPQTTNFSVSARGVPNFRVATSRPADRMPSVMAMRALSRACDAEGTKLRVAIFDGQAVSFVQVEDYELQDISAATAVKPAVDEKNLNVAVIPAAAAIAENTPPAVETAVASTDVETVQKVTDPIVIEDVTAKTSS